METENEEKIHYNWMLAFLISLVLICFKLFDKEPIGDISWWWITLPLWLPFPLSLIISLIRKFF